jgi:hypothetical protein
MSHFSETFKSVCMGILPGKGWGLFLRSEAPGLVFSNHLSTGESCPLRIPFDRLRAAVSPIDKW